MDHFLTFYSQQLTTNHEGHPDNYRDRVLRELFVYFVLHIFP